MADAAASKAVTTLPLDLPCGPAEGSGSVAGPSARLPAQLTLSEQMIMRSDSRLTKMALSRMNTVDGEGVGT